MQLRVKKMKVPGHQVHGKQIGGEQIGVVLQVGGEQNTTVAKPVTQLSWMAGQSKRDGGNRLEGPRLASFAGAKRTQLAVLMEAAATAGLREVVTGVTCLASVRPVAPRLAATPSAPIVLARVRDISPARVAQSGWMGSTDGHDADLGVDEGGIYSW